MNLYTFKKSNKMKTFSFTFLFIISGFVNAQTALDAYILNKMEEEHISGLGAALVKDGELLWFGNYGLANREENIPVTDSTMYMLASVSKTITVTAVMQLYEDGLFELDNPVNDYLPFDVYNPNYPDSVITIKQLLTHTSAIRDNWDLLPYSDGDASIPLGDFLFDYLSVDGVDYDAALNFAGFAPNTTYEYCNVAVALLGYLVEEISGQPFNEYCHENIFEPLCMDNTGWFLREIDTSLVAHPYSYSGSEYVDNGLYGYADYPDGQLRTTVLSLTKFMYAHMNYGNFDGYQLLDSTTVALMRSEIVPDIVDLQGLIFYAYEDAYGTWWGHNGGDLGVSTDMYFNDETKTGLIMLTNSDANHQSIWNEVLASMDTIVNILAPEIACIIGQPTGVEDIAETEIMLSPNPADEYISMQTPENNNFEIRIYNLQGKLVLSHKNESQIYIGNLLPGFYMLTCFDENEQNIVSAKFEKY